MTTVEEELALAERIIRRYFCEAEPVVRLPQWLVINTYGRGPRIGSLMSIPLKQIRLTPTDWLLGRMDLARRSLRKSRHKSVRAAMDAETDKIRRMMRYGLHPTPGMKLPVSRLRPLVKPLPHPRDFE